MVLDPAQRVLLFNWANHSKGTNWWATPGGGLEEGEGSRAAAIRELFEEAGIQVDHLEGPLWRASHFFRSAGELVHQFETFFLVRVPSDTVTSAGFDSIEAAVALGHRWWPLEDLAATTAAVYPRGLAELVRDVLRDGVPPKALALKG